MTMIIAVPTGVKVFNWLFTMYRGRVLFTTPMLWFMGFVIVFTIGGMDGVLMSVAPVDFQVHNSLFLIAHFHSVIIGGVLFGFFAGFTYWFPKIFGFKLNEKIGEYACFCWILGFLGAFIPLYILGLMGATRRLDHYEASTGWFPLFLVAAIGVVVIFVGIGLQIWQLVVSIRERKQNHDLTGDPWDGRTLEWSTSSPPPFYNFAHIPEVKARDPFWTMKHEHHHAAHKKYHAIHMPKNSPWGMYIGLLSFLFGFAVIWHIVWLALLSAVGMVACVIFRLSEQHTEVIISAAEIERIESKRGKT